MTLAVDPFNADVADRLEEVAALLELRDANPFRVQAYRNAASTIRGLERGLDDILDTEGLAGLDRLPHIGWALARVIEQIVTQGRLPMLERLRGAGGHSRAWRRAPHARTSSRRVSKHRRS